MNDAAIAELFADVNKVMREQLALSKDFKDIVQKHRQSLLSQRLLLLALSESVADVPRLAARYQALLSEHERTTGTRLAPVPIGH